MGRAVTFPDLVHEGDVVADIERQELEPRALVEIPVMACRGNRR